MLTAWHCLYAPFQASSSPALQQTVGTSLPLTPYTTYELKTEACTRAGCTASSGVIAVTDSARPAGLANIQALAVTSSTVTLTWSPPASPNGKILRYVTTSLSACLCVGCGRDCRVQWLFFRIIKLKSCNIIANLPCLYKSNMFTKELFVYF